MSVNSESIQKVKVGVLEVYTFCNLDEVFYKIFNSDGSINFGTAVAINPEKVLKAEVNQTLKDVISQSTLPYADGIGVVYALRKKTGKPCIRVPGCELWLEILNKSKEFNTPVALIGAKPEVVDKCSKVLIEEGVNIAFHHHGYFKTDEEIIAKLTDKTPQIVMLALGSPKQEELIGKLKNALPNCFFMGVGGSFDVLAGNLDRAPESWRKLNLEWLYRAVKQPKRILRQAKLLKFVYLYLFNKL